MQLSLEHLEDRIAPAVVVTAGLLEGDKAAIKALLKSLATLQVVRYVSAVPSLPRVLSASSSAGAVRSTVADGPRIPSVPLVNGQPIEAAFLMHDPEIGLAVTAVWGPKFHDLFAEFAGAGVRTLTTKRFRHFPLIALPVPVAQPYIGAFDGYPVTVSEGE